MISMEKTRLVIVNENTLGYITPESPNNLSILAASTIKRSRFSLNIGPMELYDNDRVRTACKLDFIELRVSHEGYEKDPSFIMSKGRIKVLDLIVSSLSDTQAACGFAEFYDELSKELNWVKFLLLEFPDTNTVLAIEELKELRERFESK